MLTSPISHDVLRDLLVRRTARSYIWSSSTWFTSWWWSLMMERFWRLLRQPA